MTVGRVRQVFISARDFDGQCRFYEQILGLSLQFRDGDNWAQFSAGDISLAVAASEETMGAAPGSWVPVFEVEDMEATLNAVESAGGSHGSIRDMGEHGRTVLAADAAGCQFAMLAKRQ